MKKLLSFLILCPTLTFAATPVYFEDGGRQGGSAITVTSDFNGNYGVINGINNRHCKSGFTSTNVYTVSFDFLIPTSASGGISFGWGASNELTSGQASGFSVSATNLMFSVGVLMVMINPNNPIPRIIFRHFAIRQTRMHTLLPATATSGQ
jgi:hypothetical protein